ncbi:hypothetical protein [Flavobacterium sp. GT3R68]|uniref:TolB family protein n=1 Tax=Flavobacterium sp. GT3R68 TaxID=2594437 RepID=UPI000F85C29D|nr:hypothetical protein [Flavobacterium sp. GT3R68]RTY95058.1 hypothetical protein EKL32_09075 [Flavobacterium sp. GSN2]TRW91864.1 hypothetical protein FNW07_08250 [Flavobacterium sp. GT3R68]
MKKYIVLIALCVNSLVGFTQNLSNIKKIPLRSFYTNPIVSPTGTHALLTGLNFHGVYLLDLKANKISTISKVSGTGYGYSWSKDGASVYFKEKKEKGYVSDSEVIRYILKTKQKIKLPDFNHNYLPSYIGEKGIVIYTNLATLKIEAKDLNTSKTWVVTKSEGQFYNAILSNDSKKVAVHSGSDIYIYNTDGSGLIQKLGRGIATSWSKDDKHIIGFLDESTDGHSISNSELYLFDVTSAKAQKITTTKQTFEMFPSFYGVNKIIYSDDKTGQIFTSEIKL